MSSNRLRFISGLSGECSPINELLLPTTGLRLLFSSLLESDFVGDVSEDADRFL